MSSRPRIVHVLDRLSPGGMESIALSLIGQTRAEYDHVIVCLRDAGELADRARALGVTVQTIDKQPGKDPRAYLRLLRCLRRLRPGVVHTYNIGAVDVAVPARLAGCRRVVHAEHGRTALDPSGSNRKYQWLRWALSPGIDRFVAVSADLERWLIETVGLPEKRVCRIYNGIDTERFRPVAGASRPAPLDRLPENTPIIGTLGRLDPVKGFDTLISAMACLRDDHPDVPGHLVIVGDGPEHDRLAEQISELGLADRVTLLGQRDDTDALLRVFDVYVCSSIAEGIALTILEAMACECPVVATAVGGNPELIEPEISGMLVAPRRPDELADAMARLLTDRETATALAGEARARVVADFSLASMVAGYRELYDALLGAHD